MALNYITSLMPGGVAAYIEDAVPGLPTDLTPVIGSICINCLSGSVKTYQKISATVWVEFATIGITPSGTLGVVMILPVTLTASVGGGTQAVTLPARATFWRVADFWLTNSSGGAGAGSVRLQRAADSLFITDPLVPGAANEKTPTTTLTNANAAIAGAGVLNFVKAAGFTASVGYVLIVPE